MNASDPPRSPAPGRAEVELAEALPAPRRRLTRATRIALRVVPVVMLIAAGWVLWREFHKLSLQAVTHAIAGWGVATVAAAIALSAASFVLMGVIEWVGLRWIGAKAPLRTVALGSFLANAIAHAIGANLLISGAIRARTYDRHGVSLTQVAGATVFAAASFAVGLSALSGAGLLLASNAELDATAITPTVGHWLGAALLAGSLGYVALCALRRRPFSAFGRSVTLPDVWDALAQLVLGVVDNGIAAAILWILLPAGGPSYGAFVGAYAVACIAGLASSVPGGAGVFESAMAALLPAVDVAALAAAFLGYRLAFYILPLIIAAAALAIDAIRHRKS
ncbi:MAG TPA: lysylphosphatidylglycerol synthase domain-containing protein [Phenylobacterium sp.]|nr:lysylphosphatidylglycerol synthase domain-containing protein [Phenylobacterium sp.]